MGAGIGHLATPLRPSLIAWWLFILAKRKKHAHTKAQMTNKTLTANKTTCLFLTAILERNVFEDTNKTWPEFKSLFC